MMLVDSEGNEPGPVGDLDLVEDIGDAVGCRRRLASRRIGEDRRETVDTDFYH